MPAPIPSDEPDQITAGTTVFWTKFFPGYPASQYALKYSLQRIGGLITITAAQNGSGDDFLVSLDATTTSDYPPGCYTWTAYVEQGTVRTGLCRGSISILTSPLAALGTTHASRTLALIEAAIEGRIPNGLESTNIDNQEIQRIPMWRLSELQRIYQAKVANEANSAGMRAGLPNRRTSWARFTQVR